MYPHVNACMDPPLLKIEVQWLRDGNAVRLDNPIDRLYSLIATDGSMDRGDS